MSGSRGSLPRLLVITDWSLEPTLLLTRLEAALSLGPSVGVQMRHPGAAGKIFFEEAAAVVKLAAKKNNPVFVNERLDVARALGTHFHLPDMGVRVTEARSHLAPRQWVSSSVHAHSGTGAAKGADFALVSPVFAPLSKGNDVPPLGAEGFEKLRLTLPCPAFALGGMSAQTLARLSFADGVAAIGSVLHEADPAGAAKAMLDYFAGGAAGSAA